LNAAQKSKAISTTISQKLRDIEIILSGLNTFFKQKSNQVNSTEVATKKLPVEINGSRVNIIFEEGVSPYEKVTINQNFYEGIVYVPKGYIAVVTGRTTFGKFYLSKELKGRVIDNLSGSRNKWKYLE
jgi:hypothetical protein